MNRFMRIVALLMGLFVVLGCQSKQEAPVAAAPDEAKEAPEAAPAEEPAEEPAEAEEPSGPSLLVAQVQGIMQIKLVKATDAGIEITYPLEVSPKVDEKSPPKAVTDAMMTAIFYTLPHLYSSSSEVDGLHQVYTYLGNTIGNIKTTRASFESLGFAEAMQGATDDASKRAIQKKLLRQLPKGAVRIKRKYRP